MNESLNNKDLNKSEDNTLHAEVGESSIENNDIIHDEGTVVDNINTAMESKKISDSDKESLIEIKKNIEQLQSDFSPEKKESQAETIKTNQTEELKEVDVKTEADIKDLVVKKTEEKKTTSSGGGGGWLSGLNKFGGFISKGISKLFFMLGIPIALGSGIVQAAKKIEKKDEKKK